MKVTKPVTNEEIFGNEMLNFYNHCNKAPLSYYEKYLIEKYLKNRDVKILDAGTGGGRIAFNLECMGYNNIDAFDFVPQMIEHAKKTASDINSHVSFFEADARNISDIPANYYDYALYLEQFVCSVPTNDISQVIHEAYRLLRKDGLIIFSFLYYNGRWFNPLLGLLVNLFRLIRKEELPKRSLPWLKFEKGFNWSFLNANQATTYWFEKDEIVHILEEAGFSIVDVKTRKDMIDSTTFSQGELYIVCKK